ncbi:MAG TPA: hypothetical protein VN578_01865 [Candidatus Binatia bacterium]|jgi:hypothetical protein|nr:hypothetical protein [Candidatus Binatia bacterium]
MKTSTGNPTTSDVPGQVELYHRVLDHLVKVENYGTSVVVRLTRDNFSALAKRFFIRHLATEGFIPDRYQRYSESSDCTAMDVKWVIDNSWVTLAHQLNRQATRILNYLSGGRLLALGRFFATLIAAAWWKRH